MTNNAMKLFSSFPLASQRPHERHLISHSDIWMALLMVYLPPLYFYRNNGSIIITLFANLSCFLFISLPVYLVEMLIGSFSNGNLLRAYSYNRFAKIVLCIIVLHQFQTILAGTANAHKILTFSLTFFLQNLNPHVSLWTCNNPWNTDMCCLLLNSSIEANEEKKAMCSTPLEEFFKHYGKIYYSGIYQPSSSTYDGGHAQFVMWLFLGAFLLILVQPSLSKAIRIITYLLTIPSLLLLLALFVNSFRQPLTTAKISNLITRRDTSNDEFKFTFFLPNVYYANQMMVTGGYLVVLHCCRKPHQNNKQLVSLLKKNLLFLMVVTIAYKSAICILRHATIGVIYLTRQRMAGYIGNFKRETHRDLFEDSKDWLYQTLFDYTEVIYSFRQEFNHKSPWMIIDGASLLHPIIMALGFIGVRIAIYKATLELVFESLGFPELMSGPWQILTRLTLPLSVIAVCLVADSDQLRDFVFPKEPYGFAFSSINVVLFLLSLLHASIVQQTGQLGRSLHWKMMEFILLFKKRLIALGILSGVHLFGAQIYKNVFTASFRKLLGSNKLSSINVSTPLINHFFDYSVGVFGSNALRVFSFSGNSANWVLNDVFYALVGILSLILGLMQSSRVLKFILPLWDSMCVIYWKPARCFRYCIEFYLAVIFGKK